ncbi:MAG: hypothetical protein ACI9YH_003271 [Colwellia sp.]|jgi:hypothetical protein
MLKLDDANQNQLFHENNSSDDTDNYYRDDLLPLMKAGNWDAVKSSVAFKLSDKETLFSEDTWVIPNIKDIDSKLHFLLAGKRVESNITNQIKAFSLACILTGGEELSGESIRGAVSPLMKVAKALIEDGYNSFEAIDDEYALGLPESNPELFETKVVMSALNRMIDYYEELPFQINFSKLDARKLGVVLKDTQQNLVIPPRFFTQMINVFSADIQPLIKYQVQLEKEIERMIELEHQLFVYRLRQFRKGVIPAITTFKSGFAKLEKHFIEKGITLVDNLRSEESNPEEWMQTFMEIKPSVRISSAYFIYSKQWQHKEFTVGDQSFKTIGQFKTFLTELDMKCKVLCLLLSGMRVDELNAMHPKYGAQSYTYNNQEIHIFTTRQSKIKQGVQTKEDIFATTKTGHIAFNLMSVIHRPFLKRAEDGSSYFVSLKQTIYPKVICKSTWSNTFRKAVNRWLLKHNDIKLSAEDASFLHITNPKNKNIKEGNLFKFTNHQTRRSFAFYLIGYELMAFPQLKQQLSHLSSAMTRHYANNATYWGSLRMEVDNERTSQKSEILARVYNRIVNNERIAGGKGKALKTIAGNNNYFEDGDNSRFLEASYWQKMIRTGKSHIHAIAPGMYCTNSNCDMRINIILEECIDCEFDVILEGMYAEGKRVNASKNLASLDEVGELTHSVTSQLVMQIKSCEVILKDLNIPFTPMVIPEHINNLLIKTMNI